MFNVPVIIPDLCYRDKTVFVGPVFSSVCPFKQLGGGGLPTVIKPISSKEEEEEEEEK